MSTLFKHGNLPLVVDPPACIPATATPLELKAARRLLLKNRYPREQVREIESDEMIGPVNLMGFEACVLGTICGGAN